MAAARAQTAGLLFAGLNSAKELSYAITLLANQPSLQAAARAEVDTTLGGRPPTYDQLTPPASSRPAARGHTAAAAAASEDSGKGGGGEGGKDEGGKGKGEGEGEGDGEGEGGSRSVTEGSGAAGASLELCGRIVNEALRLSPGIEHLRLLTTREVTVRADRSEVRFTVERISHP